MRGIATVVISMSYLNFRRYKRREKLLSFSITRKSDLAEIISVLIPVLATEEKKKRKRTGRTKDWMYLVSRASQKFLRDKPKRGRKRRRKKSASLDRCVVDALSRNTRDRWSMTIYDCYGTKKLLALSYLETSNYYPMRNTRRRFNLRREKESREGWLYKWIDDPLDEAVY